MSTSNLPVMHDENKDNEILQFVTFNTDNEEYGIEVLKVREIIRMPNITKIPNTPHFVEGIINLRGKVIPIIDIRKKFGIGSIEYTNQTRIIVMDIHSELTGFIVDSVSEVFRINSSEIQPPPPIVANLNDSSVCILGIYSKEEKLISIVNLELLFEDKIEV